MTFTLQERVARTLIRAEGFDPDADDNEGYVDAWMNHAEMVLHELGLDDFDAAVERVRRECATGFYQVPHEALPYDVKARRVMAALFPDLPAEMFLCLQPETRTDGR